MSDNIKDPRPPSAVDAMPAHHPKLILPDPMQFLSFFGLFPMIDSADAVIFS